MIQPIENLKSSYKFYRQRKLENSILRDKYYEVSQDFLKFIFNEVASGEKVELPCRTGYMYIEGFIPDKVTLIDWKTTVELWNKNPTRKISREKVYFLDEHTNRISYKYVWFKKDMFCVSKECYHFTLAKHNRLHLRDLINNGKEYRVRKKKLWQKKN